MVSALAIAFFVRFLIPVGFPDEDSPVFAVADPVRYLAAIADAELAMTEAAGDAPAWPIADEVWAMEDLRDALDESWMRLIEDLEKYMPTAVPRAHLARTVSLAATGDVEELARLKSTSPDELQQLPPELRQRADLLACGATAKSTDGGRSALLVRVLSSWGDMVLTVIGSFAIGWWLFKRRPSLRLRPDASLGSFGLGHGCTAWVWSEGSFIFTSFALGLYGYWLGQAEDALWGAHTVVCGLPALLVIKHCLMRPQGRTVFSAYAVRRSQLSMLLAITIGAVAVDSLFNTGLFRTVSSTGYEGSWADTIDEDVLFGPSWLFWIDALNAVIAAPIVEEVMFRGVLYAALRSRLTVVQAAVISAIIFGGAHGYDLVGFFSITTAGLVYALVYEFTGSLAPCALAHGLHNLFVVAYTAPYMLI